jgi:hypothetical protein
MSLPCWVDSTRLVGGNTEEDVLRRGFQFPPPHTGSAFTIGDLDNCDGKLEDEKTSSGGSVRKALLCQVAVGRAYPIEQNLADSTPLPPGYQSFYLHDVSSTESEHDYKHSYFIKDTVQVLPLFLVHFEYDPIKESKSREVPI